MNVSLLLRLPFLTVPLATSEKESFPEASLSLYKALVAVIGLSSAPPCSAVLTSDLDPFRSLYTSSAAFSLSSTTTTSNSSLGITSLSPINRWIISRLCHAIQQVNLGYNSYQLFLATKAIRRFFLREFCDVYIEAVKPLLKSEIPSSVKQEIQHVLFTCAHVGLRLLHPMMPFLTEELYQHLPKLPHDTESIMIAQFPTPTELGTFSDRDLTLEEHIGKINNVCHYIRSLRSSCSLKSIPGVYLCSTDKLEMEILQKYKDLIATLTNAPVQNLYFCESTDGIPKCCCWTAVSLHSSVHMHITANALNVEAEIGKLTKKLEKFQSQFEILTLKIKEDRYVEVTPPPVQAQHSEKLLKLTNGMKSLNEMMEQLKTLGS